MASDGPVTRKSAMKYVVVYKAGYVGEYDVEEFESFEDAVAFKYMEFSEDEIEEFHIDIALDFTLDGQTKRTYEF
jgi:hypothetical protein